MRRPIESAQYVILRYTERLAEAGIKRSMGSKGDSYDNALAETTDGLYKAELIQRRAPWRTKEAVELATSEWLHWFQPPRPPRTHRLHPASRSWGKLLPYSHQSGHRGGGLMEPRRLP